MGQKSDRTNGEQYPAAKKPDPAAPAQKPAKGQESGKDQPAADLPAAGPHADPDLTNPDATPGAGTLPDADDPDATGSTSG